MFLQYRGKFIIWELKLLLSLKKWNGKVKGNLALCPDGNYILMADYDRMKPEEFEYELKAVQNKYQLGDWHIIQSSPNKYHAVCFDKLDWNTMREILDQLRVDPAYRQSRTILLRTSPKSKHQPYYVKTIKSNNKKHQTSRAHMSHYINNIPGMPKNIMREYPCDNNNTLMAVEYTT